jgi:peptidoglycan/LPS O-acetylase OafA/YrhL
MRAMPDRRSTIAYQPALDGVRALAVAAVLLFHGEVSWMRGGYLGVSVFFTLSGFLITSLLLVEHSTTGTVSPAAFYTRRARRLLPASLLCLVAVALFAAAGEFPGVSDLRRDLLGALLQVENWVLLMGGDSYTELFNQAAGQVSPVAHYWSLSIEEQFYWLWPLAFLGLWRLARTRRAFVTSVAGATVLFAVAAPVIAVVWGPDAAYYATPARASEILVGVLLAVAVSGRTVPRRLAWLTPAGLVALGIAVVTFPAAGGPAYNGALPLVAVASGALLVGLQAPGFHVQALSLAPLVWLGRISYGVYLYHWPTFLLLDETRTDLDGPALLAVRLLVTLAVAILSFWLVESPIRTGRLRSSRRVLVGALGACAAVAVLVVAIVPVEQAGYWRGDEQIADAAAIDPASGDEPLAPLVTQPPESSTTNGAGGESVASATPSTAASTTTSTVAVPSRPVRVLVSGDSTAEATGAGLAAWAVERPEMAQVSVAAVPGCGFLRGGEVWVNGRFVEVSPGCGGWLAEGLPGKVSALAPDVVMLMTTSWDVLERRWDGGPSLLPTDPEYAARLGIDFATITDRVLEAGAGVVVWIRHPLPNVFWLNGGEGQEDPALQGVLYDAMEDVAAARPDRVVVVDLAGWVDDAGLADDQVARPDGVHWSPEASLDVARRFLGPELVAAALAHPKAAS